ncbi:putative bifunctional diguanylate cyclase/phosphodiesterase [Alteromonas sp. S015]|uniref:putative bifunctional diguanylate cyclase/phosphodiesterase n=1 Tax=Alteromonas sp. S015 TaxID=3117401 RepID=UPI002FE2CD3F
MFRTLKIPIGLVIALSMSVLALSVVIVTKLEHHALLVDRVKYNTATFSNALSLQLSIVMERSPGDNALLSSLFQTIKRHDNLLSATLYDKDYQVISTIQPEPIHRLLDKTVPSEPAEIPFGVTQYENVITAHQTLGSSLYPLGHVVLYVDIKDTVSVSSARQLIRQVPIVIAMWALCTGTCVFILYRLISPIGSLKQFTQEVFESKDYALRSSLNASNEIGQLSNNIDNLLDTIEVELLINFEQKQTLVDQQETMSRLANFDSLTGLPNRQFVLDNLRLELARAKRNDEDLLLLFFDLDGFKGINDSLGHETGDLILIEVADRVQCLLRDGDLFARLGGDEFLVLPDRDVSTDQAQSLAMRLITAFDEPFELRGLSLTVGLSVGIATASNAGYDLSELMSNADLAMYRSKARGRGSYTLFTPDMVESHKRKLHLANGIEQGLNNDEFVVYYQVKVNNEGSVIGVEALIRWQHPEFGLVMPNEFIPIAEQGGKISAITRWVIKRVCIDMPDLKQWGSSPFRASINLSGHDLRSSQLFDYIYSTFKLYDINPENIEFEVTESAYLENFSLSNKFFRRIGNMGCAIALDDFGTGYSSLSYLTQINIDTLKIDRQFVTEIQTSERSRLVTGAIIDLAKRLSLSVCAEGIENLEQWSYLKAHGCDNVQGFMFSKPIPLSELILSPSRYSVSDFIV